MKRRDFLKTSAALAATAALGSKPLRATNRVVPAGDKVRLGFIGTGRQGRGLLLSFLKQPESDIAVLCDVYRTNLDEGAATFKKRSPEGKAPELISDFRHILDRKDIDAVVVATPDHWHALQTVMACQAGKDVYVEKPTSVTVDEGKKMIAAARKYKRIVQVGTQQRSGIHFQKAVEIVQSGRLGKITFVRTWNYGNSAPEGFGNLPDSDPPADLDWDFWLGPAPKRPYNKNRFGAFPDRWASFRYFWDYAGGMVTDWGVHLIDIVLWAMKVNGPQKVSASGGKLCITDNTETPDTILVTFEFPGWICTYEHRNGNGRPIEARGYGIQFHGTDATLFVDREGYELVPETRRVGDKQVPRGEGEKGKNSNNHNDDHARNFLDCLKSRQSPICDIEIGHRSSATCILGNIAFRTGEKVGWDAEKLSVVGSRAASRMLVRPYRAPWKLKV